MNCSVLNEVGYFLKDESFFRGVGNSVSTNQSISSLPDIIFILYAIHNYCALSINKSIFFYFGDGKTKAKFTQIYNNPYSLGLLCRPFWIHIKCQYANLVVANPTIETSP
jgi:hypothetical protein